MQTKLPEKAADPWCKAPCDQISMESLFKVELPLCSTDGIALMSLPCPRTGRLSNMTPGNANILSCS